MGQKHPIIENDWISVRKAIQKIGSATGLGPTSTPTFAGLILTGLDASEFVFTNASKALVSINVPLVVAYGGSGAATFTDHSILLGSGTDAFTALGAATNGQIPIGSTGADPVLATLTGTANQINVTNAVGSITLSTPQDIHTGASPTFAGLITTGTIDASSGEVLIEDNATVEPTDKSDGYIGVAIIGGQPRLYWAVEGEMYYVEGSASVAIETGSPIGLLLVLTYNLE